MWCAAGGVLDAALGAELGAALGWLALLLLLHPAASAAPSTSAAVIRGLLALIVTSCGAATAGTR